MNPIGKTLLLLGCLCCGSLLLPAQEAVFNAHWLRAEYQPYRLTHQTYVLESADTLSSERFSMQVNVVVTDSVPGSYRLRWRMSDFSVQTDSYLCRQWLEQLESSDFVYITDRFGQLRELPDWEQVGRWLDADMDGFVARYSGQTTAASRERLYQLRDEMVLALQEALQEFHQAYGMAYYLDEVVEVPTKVQLPFSPLEVDAVVYKKLEAWQDGVGTLVSATVLDTAQVNAAARRHWAVADRIPRYRQEASGALLMHLATGWPVFTYACRELAEDKRLQGVYTDMTLVR